MTQPTNTDYKSIEEQVQNVCGDFDGVTLSRDDLTKVLKYCDRIARQEEREKIFNNLALAVHRTIRKHQGEASELKALTTLLNDPAYEAITPNDKE